MKVKMFDRDQNSNCRLEKAAFVGGTCGARVTTAATIFDVSHTRSIYVNMTTMNTAYWLTGSFTLGVVFETEGNAEQWWNGEFSTDVFVNVLTFLILLKKPFYCHIQ